MSCAMEDKRVVFSTAAHAQRAVDFMLTMQPGASAADVVGIVA
jgi:antirestriction protein ArdC